MTTRRRARWLLVTVDFRTRSKSDQKIARRFTLDIVDRGYTHLHSGTYVRFIPSKERVATERRWLLAAAPGNGRLFLTDVSCAEMSRAVVMDSGVVIPGPEQPELLTVYTSAGSPQVAAR